MSATRTPAAPEAPRAAAAPARRPDASMDLLNGILRQPVDPDYAEYAAEQAAARARRADSPDESPVDRRGGGVSAARTVAGRRLSRWGLGLVAIVIGSMFAVAALQTTRSAPALAGERSQLIDRVQRANLEQDALRARAAGLTADIDQLRRAALTGAGDRSTESAITGLAARTGAAAVTGPGLQITVDDASDTATGRDQVLDVDLQLLANGLWQAGAEAVAINGHRLSPLTAIRSAGDAITVDYRSLTRPYRVEAIGDPRTLPALWVQSGGGQWWSDLAANRSMRYEVTPVEELTLPADPGLQLRWAERADR